MKYFFLLFLFRVSAVYKKLFNYVPRPTSFLLLYYFLHEYSFLFRFPLALFSHYSKLNKIVHRIIFLCCHWCDVRFLSFAVIFCFVFPSHHFLSLTYTRKKNILMREKQPSKPEGKIEGKIRKHCDIDGIKVISSSFSPTS